MRAVTRPDAKATRAPALPPSCFLLSWIEFLAVLCVLLSFSLRRRCGGSVASFSPQKCNLCPKVQWGHEQEGGSHAGARVVVTTHSRPGPLIARQPKLKRKRRVVRVVECSCSASLSLSVNSTVTSSVPKYLSLPEEEREQTELVVSSLKE